MAKIVKKPLNNKQKSKFFKKNMYQKSDYFIKKAVKIV